MITIIWGPVLNHCLHSVNPDIIIHSAAYTDMKFCEENRNMAYKLHVETSSRLASYQSGKTLIVYISTASVFNGKKGNYKETDPVNPVNYYNETKYLGERAVAENNKNHLIVRTNIFGYRNPPGNSLAEWAIGSLERGEKINGFSDVIFNAIYTLDLSACVLKLLEKEAHGIYHVAAKGSTSKYDFIILLAELFGLNAKLVTKTRAVFEDSGTMKRPLKINLDTTKANQVIELPAIIETLKNFREDFALNKKPG